MAKRFVIKVVSGEKFAYLRAHTKSICFTMAIDDARLYKGEGLAKESVRLSKETMKPIVKKFLDLNYCDPVTFEFIPVRVEVYAESI